MDRDIYQKIIAKIKSLGTKINDSIGNIPDASTLVPLKVKTYSSASVAAMIDEFVPEAYEYMNTNDLTTAVFGGTLTGATMYSSVISRYNTGNFCSGYLVAGTSMYLVQYNAGTTTITKKEVSAT